MALTLLYAPTAANVAAATTQVGQIDAVRTSFPGAVVVKWMAGSTAAVTVTHGAWVPNSSTNRGMALGAAGAFTVHTPGAVITSVRFNNGTYDIFSLDAADLSPTPAAPIIAAAGQRINAADAIASVLVSALSALPVSASPLLTFALGDTGSVGVAVAGSIVNTGSVSATWSIPTQANCTVTPSSGTLAAGATQALSVLVPSVPGTYSLTLVSAGATITGAVQSLAVSAPAPITATLNLAGSATQGVALAGTVTLDRAAVVNTTANLSITGGILSTASPVILVGTSSVGYTATPTAAGTPMVVTLLSTSPALTPAGTPKTVTVNAPVSASAPGTVVSIGTDSLTSHVTAVRSALGPVTGETLSQADTRMGPAQNILDYCGMTMSATGRYVEFAINAGHSATGDDGFYRYDLQTESFVFPPPLFPSQYGRYSGSTANSFGEYNAAPSGWGRPADQHSYTHVVRVGNDYVQAMGYAITVNGASGSKQAHIWRASTGQWERYGSDSGGTPGEVAFCFHDPRRGRIVRFTDLGNNRNIDWIPDNLAPGDATTPWTTEVVTSSGGTFEKVMSIGSGKCGGYHYGLDCFILVSPGRLTPTNRVYVMAAGDLVGGWTEAVGSLGVLPPSTIGECNLEYVPPMDAFAVPSVNEPNKLYYIKPPASGVITDPWTWSVETFTGTIQPWAQGGQNCESRLRWSDLKRGLVAFKSSGAYAELYTPYEVAAYNSWQDRSAAALAAGVAYGRGAAAYDFSAQPANGGDWKFGSISASPKITVEVPQGSRAYDTVLPGQPYHERDLTVYPPGSRGSLKMTMPPGSHNSTDNWRLSVDEYSKQYGAGDEFWCCWRTRMNDTYARWRFKTAAGGITGPGTDWDGSYTEYKLFMSGYGMQYPTGCGEAAGRSAPYYGYGPGANQVNNLLTLHTTDVKGEIVMISKTDQQIPGPGGWMKYLQMYISKFFDNLTGRGQNISYFSSQNEGTEAYNGVKACQFIDPGGGLGNQYTDYTTCWTFPSDEWFSIMVHVVFGAEATAVSNVIGSPTRTGYVSTIEYYGAYQGQPWKLLHRKTGVVIPTDTPGAEGPCKFGIFNWTTYMTNKLSTEVHPDAIVWVSQVLLQPGPTMPAPPI